MTTASWEMTTTTSSETQRPMLEVRDLETQFFTRKGVARVLEKLSFDIGKGEIVGLVGESGSGKSVTGFSIVNLIKSPGKIVSGEILFDGRDLTKLNEDQLREIRGKNIAMIFQNPRGSLNPVLSVGDQLCQVLKYRQGMNKTQAKERAIELLKLVHIPEPERRLKAYPHQLSGGMAQRVMIAMAISCGPELLIADEPTTGLDVTIEYQIIQLLKEMRDLTGTSVIVITHDLNMAAEVCDRIMVMYAGKVVEQAPVEEFFTRPSHPYTLGLLASRPSLHGGEEIPTIPGNVPDLIHRPTGCPFHPRCRWATPECSTIEPQPRAMGPRHTAACHHLEEVQRDIAAAH
ncbi:MAG: dppD [Burkholderiales bacterium]|nr:dppD [Burkholderiales bacterium]